MMHTTLHGKLPISQRLAALIGRPFMVEVNLRKAQRRTSRIGNSERSDMAIELGQKVRDKITGLEGTAIARTEWLHGCVRIVIQPHGLKDGLPLEVQTVDEPQLEIIDEEAAPKAEPRHGPRPDALRAPVPTRR